MRMMRKHKSNKGFTLTEVIIAVAILSIAATPLISNFVKSGTVNQKARKRLNAMNVAQDLMEGFSAYKAETLINKFESAESLKGSVLPAGSSSMVYESHGDMSYDGTNFTKSFETSTSSSGGVTIVTTSGTRLYSEKLDGNKSIKAKIDKDHPDYHFFIEALKQQDVDNTTVYDVYVDMTYDHYKSSIGVDMNRLYDVKSKVDCIYSSVEDIGDLNNTYETAKKALVNKSSLPITDSQLDGKLEHHIECVVSNGSTDAAHPDYSVVINDYYQVKSAYRSSLGLSTDYTTNVVTADPIYDNGNIEAPRNIYIYYTGTQGSTITNALDTIDLVNTTGEEICFYVIRQKRSTSDSLNSNYGCDLVVSSLDQDGVTKNEKTKVVQNLRYDLTHDAFDNMKYFSEDGGTVSSELVKLYNKKRGVAETHAPVAGDDTYYDISRCDIYYNSTGLINQTTYEKVIYDGMRDDTTPAVFDISVNVYDHETHEKLATYTGSLSGGTV